MRGQVYIGVDMAQGADYGALIIRDRLNSGFTTYYTPMAKTKEKTRAELLHEIEIEQKVNRELAGQLVDANRQIETDAKQIDMLRSLSDQQRQTLSLQGGRIMELEALKETSLRMKLRKDGMSWEDIDRIIRQGREHNNMGYSAGGANTVGRF